MLWTRRRPAATAFTCLLRLRRSQSNRARSHSAAAAIAAATITTARAALSGLPERAYHSRSTHTGNACIATHTSHAFFACAHALTLTVRQAGEDIDWSTVNSPEGRWTLARKICSSRFSLCVIAEQEM